MADRPLLPSVPKNRNTVRGALRRNNSNQSLLDEESGVARHQAPAFNSRNTLQLRAATFIDPHTGERQQNPITLWTQDASPRLPSEGSRGPGSLPSRLTYGRSRLFGITERLKQKANFLLNPVYRALNTRLGRDVLRCSIAYFIASMATFIPYLSAMFSTGTSKHVVATVTVYFHPARSTGSMIQALGFACIGFLYAGAVTLTSLAVSSFFSQKGMLYVGYAVVLLLCCGGGLGAIGWVKQKYQNPLINIGCSIASLSIVTVLTKEGHVQSGQFRVDRVLDTFIMTVTGIVISSLTCFLIYPLSARNEIRKGLASATSALEDILSIITEDFLRGSTIPEGESALNDAVKRYRVAWNALKKNQADARPEYYTDGSVRELNLLMNLTDSIETLRQDLGGLQSAATMLFGLVKSKNIETKPTVNPGPVSQSPSGSPKPSPLPVPLNRTPSIFSNGDLRGQIVDIGSFGDYTGPQRRGSSGIISIAGSSPKDAFHTANADNMPTSSLNSTERLQEHPNMNDPSLLRNTTPSPTKSDLYIIPDGSDHGHVFNFFIHNLGPPMKSLAYTMQLILRELPCGPAPDYAISVDPNFRSSLNVALDLFTKARSKALTQIRQHKIERSNRTIEAVADYEEVAAGCGHFSSSLEDFAEDMKVFIDILQRITTVIDNEHEKSWDWLKFWRSKRIELDPDADLANRLIVPSTKPWKGTNNNKMPSSKRPRASHEGTEGAISRKSATFRYGLWKALRFFRRDDIKYAFKVGIGAVMYAVWAYVPATRPYYQRFRGEWGLLSYMLVCSLMVGNSNTTATQRIKGTLSGAGVAIIIWIIADENPYVLSFLGWITALCCFYISLSPNKGPMGRYTLLTYNLSALYAYSLSLKDGNDENDETNDSKAAILDIVVHRLVAVTAGCLWGVVITRLLWPIRARKKLRDGLAILWLRLSMMWKPDPLNALLSPHRIGGDTQNMVSPVSLSLTESIRIHRHLDLLSKMREAACHEITLKGPFQSDVYKKILAHTGRIVDAFYALNVLLTARKRPRTTDGEKNLLDFTEEERNQLSTRVGHLFTVLASSILLGYPSLPSALPKIENSRDRLLARLYQFRYNSENAQQLDQKPNRSAEEGDYEMFYAYSLITGQLGADLEAIKSKLEILFGELDEEAIVLWE